MLYKKAKYSWKTQEASFIVLSSFQASCDQTEMSKTPSCGRCWFVWCFAGHISGVRCCRKETNGLYIYFSFPQMAAGGWVYALLMSCAKKLCSRLILFSLFLKVSSPARFSSENLISSYTWCIHSNFFFIWESEHVLMN